ncbi:MAG TPA: hypothetical protein VGQ63_01485 [Pseudolabrys sp.]|jgi:hypothetical protein|nr:hypothetical protein [Pseudolabrys sp.]
MTAVTERMPFALNVSTAKFEQLGAEGGESVRAAVDGGWLTMLKRFKNEIEAS